MKKTLAAIAVVISLFMGAYIGAQNNAGALLQEARALKAAGDLQGAMLGLERIVSEFSADRNATANALLELGGITEQLGQANRSRGFYERVKSQYQDQAAEVRLAEARLALKTDSPASRVDGPSPNAEGALSKVTLKTPYTDDPYSFAISPDGKTLVIQVTSEGKKQLWRVPVDPSKKGEPIAGTEGTGTGALPFFSPDGKSIGYFANQKLWRIDLAGGKHPTELAAASSPGGGAWGKNDVIIFGGLPFGQPMQKVENGRVSAVTASTQWYVSPSFVEDDRFMYYARDGRGRGALEVGSIQGGTSSLATRGGLPIAQAGAFTSGYLVFVVDGGIVAQKFDEKMLTTNGTRIPISESVGRDAALPGKATYSVSLGGAVAYRENPSSARQLKWIDRSGKPVGNAGPIDSAGPQAPRISPDGRNVMFARQVGRGNSMWVMDVETGATRGMREGAARAVWSPDGRSVIFSGQGPRGQSPTLIEQPLPSGPTRFPVPTVLAFPTDVGSNGTILYTTALGAGDVFAISTGSATPVAVSNSPAAERAGRFSPNSAWIVYQSDESGRPEIYVQPFPGTSTQRQRVSLNGGINPEWDAKGRAIFFLSPDFHLMSAPAEATADNKSIEFGTPRPVFEKPLLPGSEYAVAPDGQRFFLIEPVEDAPPIVVLTNWAK